MAETTSLLEGITAKTTKAELIKRLRQAAKIVGLKEDEGAARLQEIEERVRAKFAGVDQQLKQVIVTATAAELTEAEDFLDNFVEDDGRTFMPIALVRLHDGIKTFSQMAAEGKAS